MWRCRREIIINLERSRSCALASLTPAYIQVARYKSKGLFWSVRALARIMSLGAHFIVCVVSLVVHIMCLLSIDY